MSGILGEETPISSMTSISAATITTQGSSSTSIPTVGSSITSSSDLINFSKRLSSGNEEAIHQTLQPAALLETKRRGKRSLPISGLRFSNLELIGREDEKELLEASLKRVCSAGDTQEQGGSRELVLVSGKSGTGKTALALSVAKSVKRLHGLYVKGKFDLYLRDEPYSGVSAACREICGRILFLRDTDVESFDSIRNELVDKLGSENLCLLTNVISELAEVVGDDVIMEDMKKQGSEEAKARFNYAFRMFIRVVASRFAPLVILLDDIQWSDSATLDLLQVLITDRVNPSLMVIGVYRSNEVDETHHISCLVPEMKGTSEQDDFNVTEIEIGNLSTSQVNEVIMSLLSIDEPSKTLGLAEICFKRTHGNVFSLLVFLEMLQREELLEYNLGMFKWNWDEQEILAQTAASSTVVDLMKQKIKKLPRSVGQRLSIAACLGFSFEPAILDIVWTNLSQEQDKTETTVPDSEQEESGSFLHLAEQEGFLEMEPESTAYRWSHDKVQETASSLLNDDQLSRLKPQMGRILVDQLDEKDLASYIFTIVNLLHETGIPEDETERIQLAELCLQASTKARAQSAFETAGKYVTIGVEALPADRWSNHYDLTLDLYSTAAELACSLGNIDDLERLYKEVIDQHDRPLFDKLRVYYAEISYMLGALGKHNDLNAIEMIVDILAKLGLTFPKNKRGISQATKSGTRQAIKKMSSLRPEDIIHLPIMEDPVHLEMMSLLDHLFTATYMSASDLMPLSIFARIRLTLEHGISKWSASAFVGLAMFLGRVAVDPGLPSKTGSFAQSIMTIVDCKNLKADLWLYSFVFVWTDPITRMMPRLIKAYETGLSIGDNENALWCIAQYIVIAIQSGKPLGTVEADCKTYLKQMLEFEREIVHADITIFCEMIQNLIGRNEGDPTVMPSEERFLSHSDHTVLGVFYTCQNMLYLYFGEYEKGAELALKIGDFYSKGVPGHVWVMIEVFTRGMLLYGMTQTTRKREYKTEAKRLHKTIKSWAKKGNPNVQHYSLLLNAEEALLYGNVDTAEECYRASIVNATRRGCIHESAFASERYGEFLLSTRNDPEEARYKFDNAMRRYNEWGATKKAQLLREKHQDLWQTPTEVIVDGSH